MNRIACLHCDLLLQTSTLTAGESAVCPRCGQTLYYDKRSLGSSLALLLTAIVLYFPAVLLPFLSLQAAGREQAVSLFSSITTVSGGDVFMLAVIVFALVMALPLIKFVGLLAVILPLSRQKLPPFSEETIRMILHFMPWGMAEVYLVGVLVTLTKLSDLATIGFLNGFYVFFLLIIVDTLISITLPKKRIWQTISHLKHGRYYGT